MPVTAAEADAPGNRLGRDREPGPRVRRGAQGCPGGVRGEAGAHHRVRAGAEDGSGDGYEVCDVHGECRREGGVGCYAA